MMFHGQEHGVEDNANGDGQLEKRVFDDLVEPLLELQPAVIVYAASFAAEAVPVRNLFIWNS